MLRQLKRVWGIFMTFKTVAAIAAMGALLLGCAMTSDVMDTGNGTYMISAHASPIRGGATGANDIAYQDANKYCAQNQAGTHAIVIGQNERDVYQGSVGGSYNSHGGSFGGGVFAAGNADLHFKCGQ
jgi:transcription elongation factor